MSKRKVEIAPDKLTIFLKDNFSNDSKIISEFTGNEVTRAFLFSSKKKEYVIRVDSSIESFGKDNYAYGHFASRKIIIPETVASGKIEEGLFFSITRKLQGISLDKLTDGEFKIALPEICSVLERIHSIDISKTSGYGEWGLSGNAPYKSWNDFLLSVKDSVYFNWNNLFKEGIMEKDLFDKAYGKMVDLSIYSTRERYLVHGDYGFNNILIDKGKVSGVLDWAMSRYGDFVFDISWLALWEYRVDYGEIFKEYHKGKDLANYDKRVLCNIMHAAITSMGFLAKWGDRKGYNFARNRLLKFL